MIRRFDATYAVRGVIAALTEPGLSEGLASLRDTTDSYRLIGRMERAKHVPSSVGDFHVEDFDF